MQVELQTSSLRQFLKEHAEIFDLAVTLTMKQQILSDRLDRIEASKNLRYFLNFYNKKAFGNSFTRYGKRCRVISVLENSSSQRLHYHLAIEDPFKDQEYCESVIEKCWSKTRWGYERIDVQPMQNSGWINYMTKSPSLNNWDVINTNLDC